MSRMPRSCPKHYKPLQIIKSVGWHVLIQQCEKEVEIESRLGKIKLHGCSQEIQFRVVAVM